MNTAEENVMLAKMQKLLADKGRGCGTCTLCCTVMQVEMDPLPVPVKPERVKCEHCVSAGCAIYDAKPDSCTSFYCFWLSTQLFDSELPLALRPDRVGAVIDVNSMGNLIVHCVKDNSWRLEPLYSFLLKIQRPGAFGNRMLQNMPDGMRVVLSRPSGNLLLNRDGSTQQLFRAGVNENGEIIYAARDRA